MVDEIEIEQIFDPYLRVYTETGKTEVKKRIWAITPDANAIVENCEYMPYIGQYQIEEIWKKYNNRVYISNYGYVALFETQDTQKQAQEILGEEQRWIDMSDMARNLIFKHTKIPDNKYATGCKVWLYINGKDGGSVHTMVAEKFLEKPKDWQLDWVVHHIDNNSYNNSVTNLIWLPPSSHKTNHRIFHPMSHNGVINFHHK